MEKAIIGKKIGMTQIYDEAGRAVPVTVLELGPCTVVQKKTMERDGYEAVQLGFDSVPERKLSKPEIGHLKKSGLSDYKRTLKEFKLDGGNDMEVGQELNATLFEIGEYVDVTGTSKGHGFQGVIKRHGAQRTPMTHGGGPVHRHAGSMGSGTDPGRIFKGKIGAGQMGNVQVTVQNLDIVDVDEELNVIAVRGAVPGPKGGIIYVKSTVKNNVVAKGPADSGRVNPQKASARVNPQKASARGK